MSPFFAIAEHVLNQSLHQAQRWLQGHWRGVSAGAVGAVALGGLIAWALLRRKPTAAEMEERRRQRLAEQGRIIDGVLTGAEPDERSPALVFYTYSIAGVRYECSQDISSVREAGLDVQLDSPIQVRYLLDNPGNSIVLAETWNGLWTSHKR